MISDYRNGGKRIKCPDIPGEVLRDGGNQERTPSPTPAGTAWNAGGRRPRRNRRPSRSPEPADWQSRGVAFLIDLFLYALLHFGGPALDSGSSGDFSPCSTSRSATAVRRPEHRQKSWGAGGPPGRQAHLLCRLLLPQRPVHHLPAGAAGDRGGVDCGFPEPGAPPARGRIGKTCVVQKAACRCWRRRRRTTGSQVAATQNTARWRKPPPRQTPRGADPASSRNPR